MNLPLKIPLGTDINHAPWFKERFPAFCRIGGIVILLLGITLFFGGIYYQDLFTVLEGILALFGIWELDRQYAGHDSLASQLFPRFVQIDQQGILYKSNGFRKAQICHWGDLKEIQEKYNTLHLRLKNSRIFVISLKDLEYKELKQFKGTLQAMAHKTHIPYEAWKE